MGEGRTAMQESRAAILREIRTALLESGSATKAELSRKLNLSFPTVGKFVDRMEERGEASLAGMDESSGGRRARRYRYRPDFMLGLAIFLEKNETRYIVFDCSGEAIGQGDAGSVLEAGPSGLAALIGDIRRVHPKIGAVSIGVPGAVSNGKIYLIPDYAKYQLLDLKSDVEERTGIPTVVENDMNAAVLGYISRKKAEERLSVVYLILGQNGPGAGIVVNGEVVRGKSFFSGEVSFVPQYDRANFNEAVAGKGGSGGREDAIGRLVASMTAILNPHDFIFNKDEMDERMLERVAERSALYVPKEHLPKLTASDWKRDYLAGLQALGLSLLLSHDIRAEDDTKESST